MISMPTAPKIQSLTYLELLECRDSILQFKNSRAWEVLSHVYEDALKDIEQSLDDYPVTPEGMHQENFVKGQKYVLKQIRSNPFYESAFEKRINELKP